MKYGTCVILLNKKELVEIINRVHETFTLYNITFKASTDIEKNYKILMRKIENPFRTL